MSSNNCDVRTESLGPFLIDYEHLYHCQFSQYNSLFIFLLLLWIVYLTRLLGNTASNYFSPTLGSICVKLNLSHSLAGVTFLAFGMSSINFSRLTVCFEYLLVVSVDLKVTSNSTDEFSCILPVLLDLF